MFDFIVEFNGKQLSIKELQVMAKKQWAASGMKLKDLKSLKVYINTNEDKAYAIPNNNIDLQYVIII